ANKRTGIQERLNYVNDIFSSNQTSFELISSGAYFAYVKHPFDKIPARDVARHLAEKENILCLPGSFFGPGQ
ncbi:MAG: aspartate aminotransferase, partial [Pseudomonadota bacterium]|nr:aspartate aminotransferase [Pseudomonadota bacterium]